MTAQVGEGEDVVLSCRPGGHPAPMVRWRREDGRGIRQSDGNYNTVTLQQSVATDVSGAGVAMVVTVTTAHWSRGSCSH